MDGRGILAGILQLLLITSTVGPILAQSGLKDSVSIDCGSDRDYTDPGSQINWVADAGYIWTGTNAQNIAVVDTASINVNQSSSLRYFDEGRERNCYVLYVATENTYLVRAAFHYGDWTTLANVTSFAVYLNGNQWLNMYFDQSGYYPTTLWYEAFVYMTTPILDVCLRRQEGMPFISSLELRKMDTGMYLSVVGNHKYMGTTTRINAGATLNGPYLRYPEDDYDRIWSAPGDWAKELLTVNTTNLASNGLKERPPVKVMEDAWHYSLGFSYTHIYEGVTSVGQIATYSYFQDIGGSANATYVRGMQYIINGLLIDTFNLTSDQPYEVKSCILDIYDRNSVTIAVQKDPLSDLDPILNAFEIYLVQDWDGISTASQEVKVIENIKVLLNLSDWTGDPCVPVPYDWLRCENYSANHNYASLNNQTISGGRVTATTVITNMNLSYTDMASIPSIDWSTLGNLTGLDLSMNNFGGDVVTFVQNVSMIKSLQQLNAANMNLLGEFPLGHLYDTGMFPNLTEAYFDENPYIHGILDLTSWRKALISWNAANANDNVKVAGNFSLLTGPSPGFPTISLRNNNIIDIHPSLEDMTSDIDTFLRGFVNRADSFVNYGILLGGNPWCLQTDFSAQPLSQQYLCRSSASDYLPGLSSLNSPPKAKDMGAIIGVVVGASALVAIVCFAAMWWSRSRLKKQTSALKEIQDALERQKVQPPFYKYADLRAATNEFSSGNELGHGAFGNVYKGTLLDSRDGTVEQVAVKKLYPSKQALTEFLNEVVLITGIKHRNLVQLKGCCIHKTDMRMLVYEYAENGNLAEALWDKGGKEEPSRSTLDWQQRLNICVGIARGLSYLHEELQPRIIHRDIKPPNILMDKNFNPKIADFGTARSLSEEIEAEDSFTKNVAGTKGYFSPEYATNGQLTEKADVYSFGIVLLEIVSGRRCIDPQLPVERQFLHNWARKLKDDGGNLLDLVDPTVRKTANDEEVFRVINIAFLCLDFYPEKRPRMSEAVSMLHGLMDVTFYKPESSTNSLNFGRPRSQHNYVKLALDQVCEEDSMDSLLMTGTSSESNRDLELTRLSAR